MSNIFKNSIFLSSILRSIDEKSELINDFEIFSISDSEASEAFSICDYIKGPLPENHEGLVLVTPERIDGYNCIIVASPQEVIVKIIEYIKSVGGFKKLYSDATIPNCVLIGQNVVIEDNVEIGEGSVIEHNVVIHSGSRIGKNCLIRTHSSIGGDGYGFINTEKGLIKQPHLGGVYLGDNVEIGSNTCIVRGIINDTVLSDNVKVDNLVHIAHDCFIGKDSYIIASSELSGYVKIGERSRIAPGACVKQRVNIGNDVVVGMGAVVLKNVADNEVVIGNPAKSLRQFNKKS
jgi:UDP-3-O-[3-hydroxymyristoyl] glucosamine N-acyltransferase LpxD